jgi:hypothetical protein
MPFAFMDPDSALTGLDYVPSDHVGPMAVFIMGVLVLGLGVGAGVAYMVSRAIALRAARAREHALLDKRSHWPLSEGPSRVVHGRVERDAAAAADGESDVVAEIDIEQDVSNESNKGTHWHVWTEKKRSARVQPFFIVHDGDERAVHVEATPDVLIVDTLVSSYPKHQPHARIRAAQVKHGETIYAYGDLLVGQHNRAGGGAYRDGGTGFVLRPPRGGQMLLATEAMRGRYDRRVTFLLAWALVIGLFWLVFHAAFTAPTVLASVFGTRTTTQLMWAQSNLARGKNGVRTHYLMHTETRDGIRLDLETEYGTWSVVKNAEQSRKHVLVPMLRFGDSDYASFIGLRPHAPLAAFIFGMIIAAILFGIAAGTYGGRFEWYDRKKLVEVGEGHWVETRPIVPIPPTRI